jgi:ribonuclease-3
MTIETIIGYQFKDKRLLKEALTHPSCAETHKKLPFNYQRLEFLGDSVLSAVIAELLFRLFPAEAEGSLAKRHAALVRSESLADVARTLGIGGYVLMATGEQGGGGRENDSNLEDVCEALIGAMYMDGGFELTRRFILTHWEPLARAFAAPPKDAKTALQEWAQGRGQALPAYILLKTTGPAHAPEFTMKVALEGGESATAHAASKRQAEQLAARALLDKITEE